MPDTVTIRIQPETREKLKALASEVGTSQIRLLRALAWATREDYRNLENRRLEAGEKSS